MADQNTRYVNPYELNTPYYLSAPRLYGYPTVYGTYTYDPYNYNPAFVVPSNVNLPPNFFPPNGMYYQDR